MPSTTVTEEKRRLRAELSARARDLSPAARRESDAALFRQLAQLPAFQRAETLFLFLGVGDEPDTLPLIRALHREGKRVLLPRCIPGRRMECRRFTPELPLVSSPFGIPEPPSESELVPPGEIGFALVPALCYDRRGYRLGHGGGYYDRWLAGFSGFSVGLCRDLLLQSLVPAEEHDLPVHMVVTETLLLPGDAR